MKTLFSGLVAIVALHGMFAVHAQQTQPAWLSDRITIRVKDGRLFDILESVQKVRNFTLEIAAPDRELLQTRITLNTCGERIETALKAALAAAGLSLRVIDDKTVQAFRPDSTPTPITVRGCQDRIENDLKRLLGGAPPLTFEPTSPPQSVNPATP